MPARRYLFLFSDTGGGHRSAAEAVAAALREQQSASEVYLVDALVALDRWPFNQFPRWYPLLLRGGGWPWRLIYAVNNHRWTMEINASLSWPHLRRAWNRLLTGYEADVVVSFHPLINRTLALAATQRPNVPALATVILDLEPAPVYWFAEGYDGYLCPNEDVRHQALQLGLPGQRVHVTGLPVRQTIVQSRHLDTAAPRRRLHLSVDRPLVLLVSGGDGFGPVAGVARILGSLRPQATVVVICGRNQRLQLHLQSLHDGDHFIVRGFEDDMGAWLAAADILVSKAGPNSLAEAFVMGLPIVLYGAIPGQEQGNVRLVTAQGAGIWAPTPARCLKAVQDLLADEGLRAEMGARSAALATPDAAARIARHLSTLGKD